MAKKESNYFKIGPCFDVDEPILPETLDRIKEMAQQEAVEASKLTTVDLGAKFRGFSDDGFAQFSYEWPVSCTPSPAPLREIQKKGKVWELRSTAALNGTPVQQTLKIDTYSKKINP